MLHEGLIELVSELPSLAVDGGVQQGGTEVSAGNAAEILKGLLHLSEGP